MNEPVPNAPRSIPSLPARSAALTRSAILCVLLLVLRLPLLDHPIPFDEDELGFIGGLGFPQNYPVHHPGYPLWVALGTALNAAGLPPYTAFQVWSLAASILAPLFLYLGLRRRLTDSLAWWLALAFGLNPLIWFLGTTGLSNLAGGTIGLLIVGLCHSALCNPRPSSLLAAAAILAVGISLRTDLLIYLGPMLAYAAWRFRWRPGLVALAILAVGVAACLAWTSYLYGRADPNVISPRLGHTFDVILGTSVFRLGLVDGLLRNLVKIALNLGWDFGVAVVLLPPAIWYVMRHHRDWPRDTIAILLLWAIPITAFLALMHVVQSYFVLLLAAGYVFLGLALQSRLSPRTAARIAAIVALCSSVQFVFYPWSAASTGLKHDVDGTIAFLSAAGLRHIDQRKEMHTPGEIWHTPAHDAP